MKTTSLALAIVLVALALLMSLDIQAVAAPAAPAAPTPDVECIEWAKAGPWTITRCEDWSAGEVCFMANSGMMDCKFE